LLSGSITYGAAKAGSAGQSNGRRVLSPRYRPHSHSPLADSNLPEPESDQQVMGSISETKGANILQFLGGLRGSLHVTFEEGTCADWLYDLLKPHVALDIEFSVYELGDEDAGIRIGNPTRSGVVTL